MKWVLEQEPAVRDWNRENLSRNPVSPTDVTSHAQEKQLMMDTFFFPNQV